MRGARSVLVAKGKQSWTFRPGPQGDAWSEVAARAIGPTGNLRAPTLRLGQRWIVGFGADAWQAELDG